MSHFLGNKIYLFCILLVLSDQEIVDYLCCSAIFNIPWIRFSFCGALFCLLVFIEQPINGLVVKINFVSTLSNSAMPNIFCNNSLANNWYTDLWQNLLTSKLQSHTLIFMLNKLTSWLVKFLCLIVDLIDLWNYLSTVQ